MVSIEEVGEFRLATSNTAEPCADRTVRNAPTCGENVAGIRCLNNHHGILAYDQDGNLQTYPIQRRRAGEGGCFLGEAL